MLHTMRNTTLEVMSMYPRGQERTHLLDRNGSLGIKQSINQCSKHQAGMQLGKVLDRLCCDVLCCDSKTDTRGVEYAAHTPGRAIGHRVHQLTMLAHCIVSLCKLWQLVDGQQEIEAREFSSKKSFWPVD